MLRTSPVSRRLSPYVSRACETWVLVRFRERLTLLTTAAVIMACLASCAAGSVSAHPTSQSPGATWTLTFAMSGGFAGFDRQLELSNTGVATAVDRRRQVTRTARVAEEEISSLRALIATARSLDARSQRCADCLEYALNLQANGTQVVVRANDVGLTGSDAAPLINALSRLLTRVLSGEPD